MNYQILYRPFLLIIFILAAGCGGNVETYEPDIDPANFVIAVNHPYYRLIPGTIFVFEGINEDGELERIEVEVTSETKEILGVTCVVVRDTVWVDGKLEEDTFDWFAQDRDGNVWYFGEDSKEFRNGELVSNEGSWEAGVDDAKPGIIMKADPQVGDSYRQEYYEGEAEDMAEVLSLTQSVSVSYGTYNNCLQTKEWTPLEPGVTEHKYYCPDVGNVVLEKAVQGGSNQVELISIDKE